MKKILIVIDMQNDFVDGALGTKEAEAIVAPVLEKINEYPRADIIATRDTHEENYLETQEGRMLPVAHCIRGTAGWALNAQIAEALEGVTMIDKPTFGSTALVDYIFSAYEKEDLEVEMVGLCTDICVVSNALLLKAKMPEMKITVDSLCCAGVSPKTHEAALTTMTMCQINVK